MDDSRIALISRFWAAMTVIVHGTFGILLLYALSRSLDELASATNVAAAVVLAGSAATAGWGLYWSKRSRNSICAPLACAPIPIAILLHWLMAPLSLPAALTHATWALYAIWLAPSLLATLFGLLDRLFRKNDDHPKEQQASEETAIPLPILSSFAAIVYYAILGAFMFALTAGFSRAYMPGSIVLGAIFLCLPFAFLTIGLSATLARHAERAKPILTAGLLSWRPWSPLFCSRLAG